MADVFLSEIGGLSGLLGLKNSLTGDLNNAFSLFNSMYNIESDIFKTRLAQSNFERQLSFQQNVYNDTKEREDNAIQRRVADMKAAGLNPVAATGANSSASMSTVVSPSFSTMRNPAQHLVSQDNVDNFIALKQLEFQKQKVEAEVRNLDSQTYRNYEATNQIVAETAIAAEKLVGVKLDNQNKEYINFVNEITKKVMQENKAVSEKAVKDKLLSQGFINELNIAKTWNSWTDTFMNALSGLGFLFFGFGM